MKALALFILCCVAAGTVGTAAQRERSFARASNGVHVNVTWTVKTFMAPGEPGPPIPVDSIAAAHASFSGRNVVTSSASLDRFLSPFTGHNVDWVHSAKDGCGAATPLAFVPNASAPVPYVAFFTILGQKGCLPMALMFAPVRTGNRWTYNAAPPLTIASAGQPFRRFRIARVERVRLPASTENFPSGWFVQVAYGTIGSAPAVYTLDAVTPMLSDGQIIDIDR